MPSWKKVILSGSDAALNSLNVTNTLDAATGSFDLVNTEVLQVTYISSSIIYSSGSNIFGDELTDTHTFTGSVNITGSNFTWNNSTIIASNVTSSMFVSASVNAQTASKVSVIDDESTNSNYAIIFADPATGSAVQLKSDDTTLTYNPSNGRLILGGGATTTLRLDSSNIISNATPVSLLNSTTNQIVNFGNSGGGILNVNFSSTRFSNPITASIISASSITGSLFGTASWAISASQAVSSSYAFNATSASYALSASYAFNATSASYALSSSVAVSSSYALSSSVAVSSSYAFNATSASYALSSSVAVSASYALTASYVNNAQSASFSSNVLIIPSVLPSNLPIIFSNNGTSLLQDLTDGNFTYNPYTNLLFVSGTIWAAHSITGSNLSINGFPNVSASLASLASGVGTLQQVTDAGNTTSNPISSSFAGVGFYGTASWAINVVNGGGGGGGSDSAFLDQSTPAVTWSFAHNLGTQYPVITIYDTSGQVIIPQEIDGEDTNNLKIYFPTSQSGYATAVGGTSALTYYSQSLTTASVNLNTITFTKGDSSTFDIVVNTGSIPTLQQVTTQGSSTTIPITASIISASSFTGSLFGTASWAVSASRAITSSFALTASYVNPLLQNVIITGSLLVTQSSISKVDYIDFTTTTTPAFQEGRVNWVDDTKTLAIDTELNGFQIEVGHQNVIRVRNETGITISRGRVVYLSGSSGNRPLIYTSSYEIDPTSAGTVGLVAADIGSSNNGYVISNGLIRDVNTTAFNAGAVLYLSSSGQLSTTAPVAPLHAVRMGKVITSAVAGIIHVDVDNGYEIGELHDVVDTSTNSSYGDLLVKSGSVWKSNRQLTGSYGLTGSLSATSFTGSLFGTASWANNATTSSYALTASYTPNSVVEFTNQSTWTFNHNLNNRYVIVQTLDSNHNQIIPQNIYHQDSNVVVITFPTNESGYAIAR
jgi:hypothetical protein